MSPVTRLRWSGNGLNLTVHQNLYRTKTFLLDGKNARNGKSFVKLTAPGGGPSGADGIRCDVDGNLWCGAAPGVQIVAPDGMAIGVIRLPENCANIAFGGTKRNRLFMAASQSLYTVYVNTTGEAREVPIEGAMKGVLTGKTFPLYQPGKEEQRRARTQVDSGFAE